MRPDLVIIERVGAMPKQGVSSTFRFGKSYGVAIGVVAALKIPVHFVAAGVWKRHFNLPADKEAARARALQLWPGRAELFSRRRDHNRAEAALLARYGAERIINSGGGQ
jgi:crossover junction endodeoxyribonuclease RuvC